MKETYSHPGTAPPSRTYVCIGCSHLKTVRGQWNTYTGRWLMSFTCDACGTHQEAFVSLPRRAEESKVEQRSRADLD